MKLHPAQLIKVEVGELSIVSNKADFSNRKEIAEPGKGNIKIGVSEYDQEESRIAISVKFESIDEHAPFKIKVEVRALFQIDFSAFSSEKDVVDWARSNGYYILLPYVREQAYSLSLRAGFEPILLPLVEVPTFNLSEPHAKV